MSELTSLLELLGEEPTLKLVERFGGTRVSVPKEMPKAHPLRELLGDSGFALLFQYFGGSEIVVPIARQWRFDIYSKQGMTRAEMARKLGVIENTVYVYFRRKKTAPEGQMSFEV